MRKFLSAVLLVFIPLVAHANHFGLFFNQMCRTGNHFESFTGCTSNTRSCSITNGTGSQSYSSGTWGSCTVTGCTGATHIEGNACVSNSKSCVIANGAGIQTWNGSAYGTCFIDSCNLASGYYDRGDNLTCVNTARTTVGGGWSIGQNGQITVGGIRLVQQGDGNLVIYRTNTPLWNTQISYSCNGSCVTTFQTDGNFVSKQDNPFVLFLASGTSGTAASNLIFKDDCPYQLVVIDNKGKALWSNYLAYNRDGKGGYNVRCF